MANQKKIKLREQQEIVPFFMAILKGANINERWKGSALVTQYFEDLCRCTCDFFQPNRTSYQTKLQKVKCLIFFGADTGEIFEEKIYKKTALQSECRSGTAHFYDKLHQPVKKTLGVSLCFAENLPAGAGKNQSGHFRIFANKTG